MAAQASTGGAQTADGLVGSLTQCQVLTNSVFVTACLPVNAQCVPTRYGVQTHCARCAHRKGSKQNLRVAKSAKLALLVAQRKV